MTTRRRRSSRSLFNATRHWQCHMRSYINRIGVSLIGHYPRFFQSRSWRCQQSRWFVRPFGALRPSIQINASNQFKGAWIR